MTQPLSPEPPPQPGPAPGPGSGDPRPPRPVVAGLLLAAGGGRRLGGRAKALLPYRGRPLVEHAVRILRDGGCGPVHVVTGAAADRVSAEADLTGCTVVVNPEWASGMGSSLRAGLASLRAPGPEHTAPDAVLVLLVDQPGIGAAAVARVREAYTSRDSLVTAAYDGRRGHPVLFGADRWADIAASATGDRGARDHLAAHAAAIRLVECGDIAADHDIDTPDDLRHLR